MKSIKKIVSKNLRLTSVIGLGLLLAACGQPRSTQVSLNQQSDIIKDEYIVVFKKNAIGQGEQKISAQQLSTQDANGLISSLGLDASGVNVHAIYSQALQGFGAKLTQKNLAKLQNDPRVAYIEPNFVMEIVSENLPTPLPQPPVINEEPNTATLWGLDRIDQRNLPLNNRYKMPRSGGAGVKAYIVDTGINLSHREFGGRAIWGGNFTSDGKDEDCQGHGTHVAATVGGKTYGVAKNATLVSVKVLKCDGKGSPIGILNALDWIARQPHSKSVINMSLGPQERRVSKALDSTIEQLTAQGISVIVAAGNKNDDACYYSPSRGTAAIAVAASDKNDTRAYFSNYGSCVDVFAPGVSIDSAWIGSDTASKNLNGTSMASPHVTGVAALYMSEANVSSRQMLERLTSDATPDKIKDAEIDTPNRFVYMGNMRRAPVDPIPDIDLPSVYGKSTYKIDAKKYKRVYLPEKGFFFDGGQMKGQLSGNRRADFGLALEKFVNNNWKEVSVSDKYNFSNESISYQADPARYRWRVTAWRSDATANFVQILSK